MQMTEIIKTLKHFIKEELVPNFDTDELKENESLLERGVIDSMGIMKLLAFIEEKFQVKVSDEELLPENFETLSAIAELILHKQ